MKKLRNKKNSKGFTLIELIVVIAILAILALILVPTISNYVARANEAKNLANVKAVYHQVQADSLMFGDESDEFMERWMTQGMEVNGTVATNSVPSDMVIEYTLNDQGQIVSFSATIGDQDYKANSIGQIEEDN